MFDVKPTEHLELETPRKIFMTLFIDVGRDTAVHVGVCPPQIVLGGHLRNDDNQPRPRNVVFGNPVPNVGEWTRIEIGHGEEDGKYFLSLAVGGEQVGKEQVKDPALKNPTNVKLKIGCLPGTVQVRVHPLPGFVRRVVVLQK